MDHIGKKLQRLAEARGLNQSQVAELLGVKGPSVYDWYKHGRIHNRHLPTLVAEFGKPLEWWLDFVPFGDDPATTSSPPLKTASETRRERLASLISQHGSIAELNDAVGLARTDPRLSQIRNGNLRSGRQSGRYLMGNAQARQIERALNLPIGWMDTPDASESAASQPVIVATAVDGLSAEALSLARLFDQIPRTATVLRAQAQIGCYKVILDLIQPPPR
jgi:transcriptional regulator with XRE-family HTH domain